MNEGDRTLGVTVAIQRRIAGRYWRQVSVAHASGLLAGTERINNWDLVDAVAPYVVGPWLIDQEFSIVWPPRARCESDDWRSWPAPPQFGTATGDLIRPG